MIDYRTHVVALGALEADLASMTFPEPDLAAQRDQQLSGVATERAPALLGSLIDHLLAHAVSDGGEIALLGRAAGLWQRGLTLFHTVGQLRKEVEETLSAPTAPDAADRFNRATVGLRGLATSVDGMDSDLTAVGAQAARMSHVPEHPRQQDKRIEEWGWGDLFLARRTDAFVRTAYRLAQSPAEHALAFGLLASCSANICGSAYLGQVTGGPRRSHRFRSRLAANAVGSWFAQTYPEVKSLHDVADTIRFGAAAPTLPPDISAFLTTCLTETYDPARTPLPPDLQLGYQRLIEHLELLDAFPQPAYPATPPPLFLARVFTASANRPAQVITPATASPPNAGGQPGVQPTNYSGIPGSQPTPTQTDSTADSDSACGRFCIGVLAFLGFLALLGGPCWEEWANGNRCKFWDKHIKDNFQNPGYNQLSQEEKDALASQSSPLTSEQFLAAAAVDQMNELVMALFHLQVHIWESLGKARAFLAGCGLVYPDHNLDFPLHKQFLTVPPAVPLPRRPEADPVSVFYRFPSTPAENPATLTGLYPVGAGPDAFLSTGQPTASSTALHTWRQIAAGNLDASNLDLDADRQARDSCWATEGSINDDPVTAVFLTYQDM